jgi:hypothetical protein
MKPELFKILDNNQMGPDMNPRPINLSNEVTENNLLDFPLLCHSWA